MRPEADTTLTSKTLAVTRSETEGTTIFLQIQLPASSFWKQQTKLLLYALAIICGVIGNTFWQNERSFAKGHTWVWLAFLVWLFAEAHDNRHHIVSWWRGHDRLGKARWLVRALPLAIGVSGFQILADSTAAEEDAVLALVGLAFTRLLIAALVWIGIELLNWWLRERAADHPRLVDWIEPNEAPPQTIASTARFKLQDWKEFGEKRLALLVLAIISSVYVWTGSAGNRIQPPVMLMWITSSLLWAMVFAPLNWSFFANVSQRVAAFRSIPWRQHAWVIVVFAMIVLLGARFRLSDLHTLPREMFFDQTIILQDAHRVIAENYYPIQFGSPEGRDPIHTYLMALLAQVPGFGLDHYTLKLLGALLSLLALPVMFVFGTEILGKEQRKLGIVVGLMMSGLVAVSYWHVIFTREALRITMIPILAPLTLIYLARAMRYNRRSDYVCAALILGFGLYTYKVFRFLPIVIIAGMVLAMFVRRIDWRERLRYLANLAVLVFISFIVFLPYFHLSIDDPDLFWWTEGTKVFGYGTTTEDRMEQFSIYIPELTKNIRAVLYMFNWHGDIDWKHSIPFVPALDVFTGAFLILGVAAWLALMLKSRDPVILFVPVMLFVLLMPSALAIAATSENPSNNRTSGALSIIYLLAAYPLSLIAFHLWRRFNKAIGGFLAILLCGGVILLANGQNTKRIFDDWQPIYHGRLPPVSTIAGHLKGFAASDGAFGNAFLITYPSRHFYAWDVVKLAIQAGQPDWNNGTDVPGLPRKLQNAWLRSDKYVVDPDRDLLFFYVAEDDEARLQLESWFPDGRATEVRVDFSPEEALYRYMAFRVPALGDAGLSRFLSLHDST